MNNTEVAKVKEWNKVQLLTVSLVCLAVLGAVREYIHISTPSDRAVLVYHFGGDNAQQIVEITAPEPTPEPVSEPEAAPTDNNANALPEFLNYMQEMEDKAATITFEGTVLDKIHQSEHVAEPEPQPAPQPVAEENKTEAEQPVSNVEVVEETAVMTAEDAAEIEKAKTDVMAKVLDNVEQIVADSETLAESEQTQQDDDDAAIAEYISQEQEAEEAARQQMSEEFVDVVTEDEDAPIVLLPGVLDQQ